jgi:hypothetical protein
MFASWEPLKGVRLFISIKLSLDALTSFIRTEAEQAFRVEVCDFLLIIHVDRHLIKELSSAFHAAVWIVRGKDDAIDADRVHHAQVGLVRQTPALIYRARLLVYVLTSEDATVEVPPKVFLDGPFQPTFLFNGNP